jgi:hypothetical protein
MTDQTNVPTVEDIREAWALGSQERGAAFDEWHDRYVDETLSAYVDDLQRTNNERMRYADGYHRVQKERDALAAKLTRLENMIGGQMPLSVLRTDLLSVIEEDPTTSLALHDADVLSGAADQIEEHYYEQSEALATLRISAARLRGEVK